MRVRTKRIPGRKATVTLPGGDLIIEWRADDHVMLTGPAEFEFSGEFDPADRRLDARQGRRLRWRSKRSPSAAGSTPMSPR